ncbi:ADM_collapsed_G0020890.mRNA.1.CDS.1 [Saccharomyces cerevisiae]|nr:ADM_collapsed_G0020890.mRNA.1.CDS.1 [Saccharomyces cerevisiae]
MCNFPSAPCTKPSERRCLLEFKARKGYKIGTGRRPNRDGRTSEHMQSGERDVTENYGTSQQKMRQ